MKEWLTTILSRIAAGTLLPAGYYGSLDRDAALGVRDSNPEFVATWARVFDEIASRWPEARVGDELLALAEDIRRESFLAVSGATGQHEIASYVSDDLDLIVRGGLVKFDDPLLGQLWGVYDCGEFPTPPL